MGLNLSFVSEILMPVVHNYLLFKESADKSGCYDIMVALGGDYTAENYHFRYVAKHSAQPFWLIIR